MDILYVVSRGLPPVHCHTRWLCCPLAGTVVQVIQDSAGPLLEPLMPVSVACRLKLFSKTYDEKIWWHFILR